MRSGKRLAFDVGSKRIGLAISDPEGILASPLATVGSLDEALNHLDESLLEIYIGLPLNLQGNFTQSTELATDFGYQLQQKTATPIRFIDERLTTSLANQQLREVGKAQKQARNTIDQMAAVAILEYALQQERNSGSSPGKPLEELER